MPLLEIDQSTVASPIDGRFHYTGSTWHPTLFDIVARCHLGCFIIGTAYAKPCHFLRFKIPLATGEATINSAQIKFYTQPDENFDFADGIKVNILAHDADNSSGPASHSDCITQSTTQATAAVVSWEDPELPQVDPGLNAVVLTVDFAPVIEEVLARAGWASGNYITIYLVSTAPVHSALLKLHTKGYNDYVGENEEYNPKLLLDVHYHTGGDNNVEDTLDIVDYNIVTNMCKHPEDTLDIQQDIDFSRGYTRNVEDTLDIVDEIHWSGTKPRIVYDDVVIDNIIGVNVTYHKSVEHVIDFTQDIVRNGPKDKQLYDDIVIEEDIEAGRSHSVEYFDDLDIQQTIRVPLFFVEFYDDLNITQTISLSGTSLIHPHSVIDTLDIEQDIDYNRVATRAVEHTLVITDVVLVQAPSQCREDMLYQPAADDSVGFALKPTLTPGSVILQYPVISPTSTITLRKPILGNKDELQLTRIQRETRGGDLKTFIDSNWPQIRVQRYKFEHISDTIRNDYFDFLMLSLGLKIKLTDYEGRVWNGHILTPDGTSLTIKDDTCSDTLEFDFVGVLV